MIAKEWHPYKNGDTTANDVPYASNKHYWWLCSKCGHDWEAPPQWRTIGGNNCPKCSFSYGEDAIYSILSSWGMQESKDFICQKKFPDCKDKGSLRFDFYLDKYKLSIEFHGRQHYEPVDFGGKGVEWAEKELIELQRRDSIKQQYCYDHNINLLIIPYWDFDNIEQILYDTLNNLSNN
jgi:hypothetical protein